jgi:hypothetical protein
MEIYILRVSRMLPSTGTTRVARWCLDARHSIEQAKIMIAAAKFTLRSSNVATEDPPFIHDLPIETTMFLVDFPAMFDYQRVAAKVAKFSHET